MARKRSAQVETYSYGIYERWDPASKDIPSLKSMTDTIPARLGIEFGIVLHIQKARGKLLKYTIEHPPFPGSDGTIAAPFDGEEFIRSNDYQFFLGDTIWAPVADKLGTWTLRCRIDGELVAEQSFTLTRLT